jgi:hypothetical protein
MVWAAPAGSGALFRERLFGGSSKMDKFERVYIEVPIDEEEAAKRIGARWDQSAEKWWVRPGVETVWPVVEVAWKKRRDECGGSCFGSWGQILTLGCGACEMIPCPRCGNICEQRVLEINREHDCPQCAAARSSGLPTMNEELERRRRGGRRICLACGKPLVPIGSARVGGAAHDDWDTRLYHKSCMRK